MSIFTIHPFGSHFWSEFRCSPEGQALRELLSKSLADAPARAPRPSASDFLAAKRHNRRDIVDNHWQIDRYTLSCLVADRLLNDSVDDDRLLDWIFDMMHEATWAVAAHLPNLDLPRSSQPTLDLASCEFACSLAELREVLLPWLQQQSRTLDMSIIDEIDRRILTPFAQEDRWHWADPNSEIINNWSGVCGGAVLDTCLSLEAQGFPRPEAKRKAIAALNLFWDRAFTATGECDEGPAYWNYGVSMACLPMMRMTREQIEAEFDVARIRAVANYMEKIHIHNGYFLATNDSVSRLHAASWYAGWLAEFVDSDFLRWWSSTSPTKTIHRVTMMLRHCWQATRPPVKQVPAPSCVPVRYLSDQQTGIYQRPTAGGPLFTFSIGGGHNAESHNHNDLGAFQLILDDVPWIIDVGQPHYLTDFFSSKRYEKYICAASSGHCCPAINGCEQRAGRIAAGVVLERNDDAGKLALDLTSAYGPEAGLKLWHRESVVPPGVAEARVRDSYELERDGVITHRLWFRQRPDVDGTTITCGPVVVKISVAPEKAQIHEFDGQDPRLLLREYPAGHKIYRVDMDYRLPQGKGMEVSTTIGLK